jgi:hypothetical protein
MSENMRTARLAPTYFGNSYPKYDLFKNTSQRGFLFLASLHIEFIKRIYLYYKARIITIYVFTTSKVNRVCRCVLNV